MVTPRPPLGITAASATGMLQPSAHPGHAESDRRVMTDDLSNLFNGIPATDVPL